MFTVNGGVPFFFKGNAANTPQTLINSERGVFRLSNALSPVDFHRVEPENDSKQDAKSRVYAGFA